MGAGFYSGFQLAHEVLAPTRLRVVQLQISDGTDLRLGGT